MYMSLLCLFSSYTAHCPFWSSLGTFASPYPLNRSRENPLRSYTTSCLPSMQNQRESSPVGG